MTPTSGVLAAAPSDGGPELPATGAESGWLITAAGVLLSGGILTLLGVRRRVSPGRS